MKSNHGVSLYHNIRKHIDPQTQSSMIGDFVDLFTRKQKNGETIDSLSTDLKAMALRLKAGSFEVSDQLLTLNLV